MAKLVHVPMPAIWQALTGYLEAALEASGAKADWGVPDVFAAAERQELDIWALMEGERIIGGCATALNVYPRRRVVDVLLLGTEPHHETAWRECLEQLKEHARNAGADIITGTGRPGWARKLGARERRVFELEV